MQSKDLPVKTGGIKHDNGKPRPDLIFSAMARALLEVSKVAAMGAAKYDDDNWLIVEDASKRYRDAKGRHLLLSAIEAHDNESNITHLAHEAWNALAVLELHLRQQEEPKKPIENWPESAGVRSRQIMQNGNDGAPYKSLMKGSIVESRIDDGESFVVGLRYLVDKVAKREEVSDGVVTQLAGDVFIIGENDLPVRFSAEDARNNFRLVRLIAITDK